MKDSSFNYQVLIVYWTFDH